MWKIFHCHYKVTPIMSRISGIGKDDNKNWRLN